MLATYFEALSYDLCKVILIIKTSESEMALARKFRNFLYEIKLFVRGS